MPLSGDTTMAAGTGARSAFLPFSQTKRAVSPVTMTTYKTTFFTRPLH